MDLDALRRWCPYRSGSTEGSPFGPGAFPGNTVAIGNDAEDDLIRDRPPSGGAPRIEVTADRSLGELRR